MKISHRGKLRLLGGAGVYVGLAGSGLLPGAAIA